MAKYSKPKPAPKFPGRPRVMTTHTGFKSVERALAHKKG